MADPVSTKRPWESKTVCLSIVTAAAPLIGLLYPPAGTWLHDNADFACTAIGIVFGALRFATDKGVAVRR